MSSQPLLPSSGNGNGESSAVPSFVRRHRLSSILIPLLLIAGVLLVAIRGERVPKDSLGLAKYYLKTSPVIDGHIDLPELARMVYGNNVDKMNLRKKTPGHVDIPRIREGFLGGFFWSIFVMCPESEENDDFMTPTNSVRDTLEQIDVSLNLIDKYSDTFAHCRTADDVMRAVASGKVASIFGLEGGHSLGNSIGALRMFHQLGIRYMTLTHSCNNAFADSGGIFTPVEEKWGGLSPLGHDLIKEMNRIGILVDISHVSEKTALQALATTRAPVILSHSCARHLGNISRNVPDKVLDKIGRDKHKIDGVVMVNFFPAFAAPGEEKLVDVKYIADHITYISDRIGKHHVGIGSDYDGIESVPKGLEDVSKYPYLFAELIERGWTESELSLLSGGNILRVMRGMEAVSAKMAKEGQRPSYAVYDKRHDLDGGFPIEL
ncbi:microsomal dipeptidase precursor (Dehydropeptidase-I) [Naematelia encephala]|uniref:Dipeptidase n=1 Tax=Naematelia encephala TaxID=71784 RepID=A0A1Y2AHV5_9TREE|nr:microsomal dipeptidase precursor (Dehydropeptidase-I) [Naematelia encephala]